MDRHLFSSTHSDTRYSLVGARYEVINEIGHGGFGSVYRALDRLTGRVLTIKRMRLPSRGDGASTDTRRTLAQEFELLASLQHPNIITVLDYGFDEDGDPYLVMDLEEHAVTILEAGAGKPVAVQTELLVQTLRALLYLHRVGIIHRDLKPENVLVVRGQVKVLDFGLSLRRGKESAEDRELAGSPGYISPEVLSGEGPSEQSDLYAFGVIAYQLFVGGSALQSRTHPVPQTETWQAILLRPDDPVPAALRPVLEKLLHPDVRARYGDAARVIAEISQALGWPYSAETVATRESLLQAAPLVGREREIDTLYGALRAAGDGNGSTWLLAGESGVGKSRLVDELRTRGLVDGFVVLRGQAVDQGSPYHAWRLIVSTLLLWTPVGIADAEVLKQIVPEIERLTTHPVGDSPALDPEGTQTRLLLAVEALFRQQARPVLVILEDVHWAGSESLKLLAWLAQPATPMRALFVASFRDDETPGLTDAIPGARELKLERLDAKASSTLAESMIGPGVCQPEVLRFIQRETEGIPLFIVEVVRALAEASGALDRISDSTLPERILPGGIRQIAHRRITRLSSQERSALQTAAVIGRAIDVDVMRIAHDGLDLGEWTAACARSAVLDLRNGRWEFAHDKIREQLLDDLSADVRRSLHRRAAEAVERAHPHSREHLAALAHHWREAGEPAREAEYAREAGFLALRSGAASEAVQLLSRALVACRSLVDQPAPARTKRRRTWLDPTGRIEPDGGAFTHAAIEGALCEAYFRLGDMTACQEHAREALALFGCSVPDSTSRWVLATLAETVLRMLQRVLRVRSSNPEAALRVAEEAGRVQLRLTEVFFYSLRTLPILWSALRMVNQCEPAGPSAPLAQGYIILAILAGSARARRLGDSWAQRAVDIAAATGAEYTVAWVQSRAAVYRITECQWEAIEAGVGEATRIAERVGDVRLWTETCIISSQAALYRGDYEKGLMGNRFVEQLSRRSGNRQGECWALLSQTAMLIRLGQADEAQRRADAALLLADRDTMKSEAICALSGLAMARFLSGNHAGAYEASERALGQTRETKPVAYWLQAALAFIAEALLSLQEAGWAPDSSSAPRVRRLGDEAVDILWRFARQLPLGRPYAHLWRGLSAWLAGRESRAMREWHKAASLGAALGLRYEVARAHFEIGRHLPVSESRASHLRQAQEEFERLGCAVELERIRDLVGGRV
jgi:tetratricopeptide (TPR) repeat protein